MRSIFGLILLLVSTQALSADFSVELSRPVHGLRECQVVFSKVPPKSKVDAVMASALNLCRMVDVTYDIQVMAFRDNDPLDESQETYTYLTWYHRKHSVQRVTFNQFLKELKPAK
jgi:hypothetical protein